MSQNSSFQNSTCMHPQNYHNYNSEHFHHPQSVLVPLCQPFLPPLHPQPQANSWNRTQWPVQERVVPFSSFIYSIIYAVRTHGYLFNSLDHNDLLNLIWFHHLLLKTSRGFPLHLSKIQVPCLPSSPIHSLLVSWSLSVSLAHSCSGPNGLVAVS